MGPNPKKNKHGAFLIRAEKRCRDAFILATEGYTLKEIGEKMGLAIGTVQTAVARAKKQFEEDNIRDMQNAVKTALQSKLRICNELFEKAETTGEKTKVLEQYRKFMSDIARICGLNEQKLDITTKGEPIVFTGKEWNKL
ncbi:MAG: hypothetical protein KOO65_08600 [Desulfobacterales bacterium]|nr:hypothetical protein [Desulfobacterales bacterium]